MRSLPSTVAALVAALSLVACGGRAAAPATPAPTTEATPADGHHGHDHGHGDHRGHQADHVTHDFSDVAKWVAVFDDPARDSWQRPAEVIALLGPGPGHVVADIGAGTGYFVGHLSRAVGGAGQVHALDTAPPLVAHLADRAKRELWTNVVARQVAPDDPGLPTAGVDRILIVDTWHHLPDRPRYAARLAAALRPGGAIAIVDFTLDGPMGPPPSMRLSADVVIAELRAAGLSATVARESLPHQYVVLATKDGR